MSEAILKASKRERKDLRGHAEERRREGGAPAMVRWPPKGPVQVYLSSTNKYAKIKQGRTKGEEKGCE